MTATEPNVAVYGLTDIDIDKTCPNLEIKYLTRIVTNISCSPLLLGYEKWRQLVLSGPLLNTPAVKL